MLKKSRALKKSGFFSAEERHCNEYKMTADWKAWFLVGLLKPAAARNREHNKLKILDCNFNNGGIYGN
jgi:hypothetical protein